MSRAIQIRISESVVRTIHVEDGVSSPLEMLPVLPADRMGELLAVELEARGFTRDGGTMRRTDPDGIEITVDLAAATVTVRIAQGAEVSETATLGGQVAEEKVEQGLQRLRDRAKKSVENQVAARAEQLQREVTTRLERKLGDIAAELDAAIGKTTVAALTERAGQLGQIEELVSDDAGNVTIRVKL
ncbi:MAG: hypothetical protein AB7P03_19890 [Kofleriaceae bacterium]